MIRNLDHRVEASVSISDPVLQNELINILQLQLAENEKARILDNDNPNQYVPREKGAKVVRSQVEISKYLRLQKYNTTTT
jgi:polyphosphate kinase